MSDKSTSGGTGIGCFTIMFLIFMTLKLCGVINWSWWWVTAPLWGSAIALTAFFGIILVLALISKRAK